MHETPLLGVPSIFAKAQRSIKGDPTCAWGRAGVSEQFCDTNEDVALLLGQAGDHLSPGLSQVEKNRLNFYLTAFLAGIRPFDIIHSYTVLIAYPSSHTPAFSVIGKRKL